MTMDGSLASEFRMSNGICSLAPEKQEKWVSMDITIVL